MKQLITIALLLLSAYFTPAFSNTRICTLHPQTSTNPASLKLGDQLNIDFGYETDEPTGVRIFIRPFSAGNLTPNYAASGSGLYTGTGSDVANFTITGSTPTLVDELRVQVFNNDQTTLLYEFFVPVKYYFDVNAVKNITYVSSSGSYLNGHSFNLNFDYDITEPGGARIFFRPFSGGSLTPGYSASGSALYTGTGSDAANFSITSGINVTVDAIRIQVYNAAQSVLLKEFFIPVYLKFSSVEIKDIVSPGSIYFNHNDNVDFTFNYETSESSGARIFFRPFSDDAVTPLYAAAGSPLYALGAGPGATNYTVTNGNTIVDQTRIQAYNADQSQLLLEYFIPADYVTGTFDFYNFGTCPPSPARMANGTFVHAQFNYNNMTGANARLFVRPYTGGAPSPNYAASGSPSYAPGAGTNSGDFTISSGDVVVDALHVQVTDDAQANTLMEFLIPVHFVFGAAVTAVEPLPDELAAISIAPNPGSVSLLTYRLNSDQSVNVSVYDLMGKCVKDFGTRLVTGAQDQSLSLDGATLPDGLYLVRLSGPKMKAVQKWVVSR
jgi:hypothetical protein